MTKKTGNDLLWEIKKENIPNPSRIPGEVAFYRSFEYAKVPLKEAQKLWRERNKIAIEPINMDTNYRLLNALKWKANFEQQIVVLHTLVAQLHVVIEHYQEDYNKEEILRILTKHMENYIAKANVIAAELKGGEDGRII